MGGDEVDLHAPSSGPPRSRGDQSAVPRDRDPQRAASGRSRGAVPDVGYFFTVYGLVLFVASPLGGRAVDRFGYLAVLPMLACIVGSMYLISVSDTIWTLLAAAVVGAFGYGAAGPVARSMAMGVVPEGRRGAASSTLYLGSDLGQLAGPLVGGVIATTLGYATMYRIAPISIGVAAVILLLARKTLERRRTELVVREETGSVALVAADRR